MAKAGSKQRPMSAWLMVGIALLFQILAYGGSMPTFSFWVSHWTQTFHASRATVMIAPALVMATASLLAPTVGRLADRLPIKLISAIGLISFATGFFLVSRATEVWQAVAAFGVMMGIGLACAGPLIAQTLTAKWFREQRGLAMGIVSTGPTVGDMVLAPLLVALLYRYEWRTVALILAASAVPVILLILAFLRDGPHGPRRSSAADPAAPARSWTTRELLFHPNFWPMLVIFVPQYMATMAIGSNLAPLFADHGLTPADAALATMLFCVVAIPGKIIIGRLSDSVDHRLLVMMSMTMYAIGFLAMLGHVSLPRMQFGYVALALGTAGFYPMPAAIIGRHFGTDNFGRVFGLLTLFYIVAALGGPIAGAIRDHFGSYAYFQIGAAIVLPLSGLVVFRLGRSQP